MRNGIITGKLPFRCFDCENYVSFERIGLAPFVAIGLCKLFEKGQGYIFPHSSEPCCEPLRYQKKGVSNEGQTNEGNK